MIPLKHVVPAFILIGSFLNGGSILAQEPRHVSLGDRIRVTATQCGLLQQTGVITSLEPGLFTLAVNEEELRCPVEAVGDLEVSLGKRHWWKSSLAGLGIGAVSGSVTLAVLFHCGSETEDCPPDSYPFFVGAMLGGLSGVIIGSLVGAARGSEGWREVPVPLVQPSVHLSPRGALRFSVSFRK
jgi:hypothetical protein